MVSEEVVDTAIFAANMVIKEKDARIEELEVALREIAKEMEHAHDGACILSVREICAKALAR